MNYSADDFATFYKNILDNNINHIIQTRLVNGHAGRDGYEKEVGKIAGIKLAVENIDACLVEFKKQKDKGSL